MSNKSKPAEKAKAKPAEKAKAKPAEKAKAKPAEKKTETKAKAKTKAKKPAKKKVAKKAPAKATIPIYCEFKGKRTDATYNEETQKVSLNGKEYDSVSAAGKAVTKYAVNGWKFWRFEDSEGWCFLDDLYTR